MQARCGTLVPIIIGITISTIDSRFDSTRAIEGVGLLPGYTWGTVMIAIFARFWQYLRQTDKSSRWQKPAIRERTRPLDPSYRARAIYIWWCKSLGDRLEEGAPLQYEWIIPIHSIHTLVEGVHLRHRVTSIFHFLHTDGAHKDKMINEND